MREWVWRRVIDRPRCSSLPFSATALFAAACDRFAVSAAAVASGKTSDLTSAAPPQAIWTLMQRIKSTRGTPPNIGTISISATRARFVFAISLGQSTVALNRCTIWWNVLLEQFFKDRHYLEKDWRRYFAVKTATTIYSTFLSRIIVLVS